MSYPALSQAKNFNDVCCERTLNLKTDKQQNINQEKAWTQGKNKEQGRGANKPFICEY